MLRADASIVVSWVVLAAIGLSCAAGCNSAARREQLVSPYPLDRARAAVQLAEAGDTEAVDLLIELLNDQDRGVRMYTILALKRLCGETYGYDYYDPEPQRAAAVARWREARRRGDVSVTKRARGPEARSANPHPGAEGGEEQSQ
jgi:HEAT repeat protein